MVGMGVGMAGEVLASWKCVCMFMLGGMAGEVAPGEGIYGGVALELGSK